MRMVMISLMVFVSAHAAAEAPAAPAPRIGYASVDTALKDLESRDGNGTIVTHADGWTIINEPLTSAQWSFTPTGYYAYPAVVRRTIKRSTDGSVAVDTASLCEAPEAECGKLLAEFAALNERITQAIKARGRVSAMPATPATP